MLSKAIKCLREKRKRKRPKERLNRKSAATDLLGLFFRKRPTFFYQALLFKNRRQFGKALFYLEKVLHLDPKNEGYLMEMGHLGYLMKRQDIEINALLGLYNYGLIKPNQLQPLCQMLEENGKYKQALSIIQKTLKNFSKIKAKGA